MATRYTVTLPGKETQYLTQEEFVEALVAHHRTQRQEAERLGRILVHDGALVISGYVEAFWEKGGDDRA